MEAFAAILIALVGAIAWLSYNDRPSYFRSTRLLVRAGYPVLLIFFSLWIGTYIGKELPERIAPLFTALTYVNATFAVLFSAILFITFIIRPNERK